MADSRNLYFVLIFFDLIHAKCDFISLFVLRNAIFISEFIICEYVTIFVIMSSVDVNPDFLHQSNEIRLLCSVLENALMQENGIKMSQLTTAESLTSNI